MQSQVTNGFPHPRFRATPGLFSGLPFYLDTSLYLSLNFEFVVDKQKLLELWKR